MKISIIGRSELMFESIQLLRQAGHEIVCVVTAKAAPEYTKTESDFKSLAAELNVPFAITPTIKSAYDLLLNAGAEVGVSVNYSGIIPEAITGLFPLGILNAHGGDLPRYRGNACQAWAILNGEERVGLCIHKMIGGELDNGDIIARDYLPINSATKVTAIWNWMQNRIPALFVNAINNLSADRGYVLEVQSKNPADALRCYPRIPDDGKIDWNSDVHSVLRLINASNLPYSGAFCYLNDKKIIIWDAEIGVHEGRYLAVPGQIVFAGEGVVHVACGRGILYLREIESEGVICKPDTMIKSIRTRLR
jgi:methionyl-tRNA formyltransferase